MKLKLNFVFSENMCERHKIKVCNIYFKHFFRCNEYSTKVMEKCSATVCSFATLSETIKV
jgi:hypothetical protein